MSGDSSSVTSKKIFISYSHADAAIAIQIKNALQGIGMQPWVDSIEIKPGQSFLNRMNEGLSVASYVLALISQNSNSSYWVNREWMAALASRDIVFVPVRLDNAPVPALLGDILYLDLRENIATGIESIVKFFLLENGGPIHQQQQQQQKQRQLKLAAQQQQPQQQQQQQQQPTLRTANRRQIRLVARRCIDDDVALRSYCFDAEIPYARLGGGGIEDKLLALLHELEQRLELDRFVIWLENERGRCVLAQISVLSQDPDWNWSASSR